MLKVDKFKTVSTFAALTLGILIFSFQNCSKVRLTKTAELPQVATVQTDGSFCSVPASEDDIIAKVIFIVDMSGSNIRTPITDPTGKRFTTIENFLTSTCGVSNPNNKFAVLGFSRSALGSNCSRADLVDKSGASAQIAALKNIQATEPANANATNARMQGTYYEAGIDCANEIVRQDIQQLIAANQTLELSKTSYHVMFLSDGQPTNNSVPPMAVTDPTTLYSKVRALMTTGQPANGVTFQPILYGKSTLPPAEAQTATSFMEEMARIGLSLDSAVDDPGQINFCDLFKAGKRTSYVVTDFGVINLTASMVNGVLEPDSDLDGKPDSKELLQKFDPRKARSGVNGNLIMDGFCNLDSSKCIKYPSCSQSNLMGFTQCEIDAYRLSDGLDSDRDGIPDYVEFLKGTLATDDSDRINDVDGDGLTNILEVLKGRDPNFWDNDIPSDYILFYQHNLLKTPVTGCPTHQQSWKVSISSVPLVKTLATNNSDPVSLSRPFMNHLADENVLFVYYIINKANQFSTTNSELYGQFIKAAPGRPISFGQFNKIGDINGTFLPKP